ncbi:hypothetical protein HYN48_10550 [Flavobacterium magnum]|uniref:Outer membrane protein beta-barrel domain-containing protein n=1 Tax=Flavobacterium magnum TaxID=2162713 RepID=A0A2S0RID6_9FLAO|nr:DUF6048 family protein [Flavobacterium magnum]AWA30492.1 hypothetical protein HYN48_10550 [Flavobacterium magnum]
MKHTLKYFFSAFFLCMGLMLQAQEVKKDSVKPKKERYGVRVGADLFKLSRSFYDKDYKGIEFSGDYRLTRKYYLAAEIGNENKTTDEDQLNFTTKGSFLRLGFDYNMHENWLDLENMIYVGLRYGISTFSQELNSYKVYNPNPYFNETSTIAVGEKYSGLSAQWVEAVAGMKAQVFNNIFVGFSIRLSTLVSNRKPSGFDNLYIPGFNRTYDGDFGFGFNYSVSYFLPLYKKQVKMDQKKSDEAKAAK